MDFFLTHFISSAIAFILIFILGIQCIIKKMKWHKELSFAMLFSGIASLVSSYFYGFKLSFDLSLESLHIWIGFASLICSIIPFVLSYILKKTRFHYNIGYASMILASLALLTGLIPYSGTILGYLTSPFVSDECITLEDMQSSDSCLVAVDGIIYDMTSMPRWQTGTHYDYSCGGNYSKEYIISVMPSHSLAKYYGPVYGYLCE